MNDAMRRATTSAIGVLLLYATAASIPTSTATPCIGEYVIFPTEDSCVPGETDIGNHGDDTVTTVALPFPYTFCSRARRSTRSICHPTAVRSSRQQITPGLTFACRGSATTSPSSRMGRPAHRCKPRLLGLPRWHLWHLHLDFRRCAASNLEHRMARRL